MRGLPLPWRTLFTLAVDTGLRAGEVIGVRVRDLEWTPGAEGIRGLGKGGRWREVPLLPRWQAGPCCAGQARPYTGDDELSPV